jgi:hypothetical protein
MQRFLPINEARHDNACNPPSKIGLLPVIKDRSEIAARPHQQAARWEGGFVLMKGGRTI